MKKIVLMMALISCSVGAMAGDTCAPKEGSIVYDSATASGTTVVVVNPRLQVAGAQALIKGLQGRGNVQYYGTAICRALGMSSGVIDDIQNKPQATSLIAEFNLNGVLVGVGQERGYYGIKTVICQK